MSIRTFDAQPFGSNAVFAQTVFIMLSLDKFIMYAHKITERGV